MNEELAFSGIASVAMLHRILKRIVEIEDNRAIQVRPRIFSSAIMGEVGHVDAVARWQSIAEHRLRETVLLIRWLPMLDQLVGDRTSRYACYYRRDDRRWAKDPDYPAGDRDSY